MTNKSLKKLFSSDAYDNIILPNINYFMLESLMVRHMNLKSLINEFGISESDAESVRNISIMYDIIES